MSQGFVGMGVKLLSDAELTDTFVEVPEVNALPEFGQEADEVDFTHLNSPGGVKEYKAGMKDGSGSTIELNWIPGNAQHDALRTAADNGDIVKFQIQWPDTAQTQVEVPLLVKSFKVSTSTGDKVTASIDVKVAGAATWGDWT
ncbi:phage tail tube protein [Microbulbifer sp. 2201CG32-9]|uniref:phage tail tube protein n=1 Tax=Microbulbifer sp. 2201CG32-9 TaxID=3232309 RepID=UPI00345BF74B